MTKMIHKGIGLAIGVALAAQTPLSAVIDATDLLTNSPFVHAKVAPGQAGAAATAQQYVFRGMCKMGEDILVNVSDTVKKKTYWLKPGETSEDIKVVSYDNDAKKVTIVVGSRDYVLELAKPKVLSVQAAPATNTKPEINKNQPDIQRRIRRVRRPGPIPPAPPNVNFNDPNFPKNFDPNSFDVGGSNRRNIININSSDGADNSTNHSNNSANTEEASSNGTATTPPTTIPGDPPDFIPVVPDSVRLLMESNTVPSIK
jgi:hypothetical protein